MLMAIYLDTSLFTCQPVLQKVIKSTFQQLANDDDDDDDRLPTSHPSRPAQLLGLLEIKSVLMN